MSAVSLCSSSVSLPNALSLPHCTVPASLRYVLSSQPFLRLPLSHSPYPQSTFFLFPWDQFLHCSLGLLIKSYIKRNIFLLFSHLYFAYEHKIEGEISGKGQSWEGEQRFTEKESCGSESSLLGKSLRVPVHLSRLWAVGRAPCFLAAWCMRRYLLWNKMSQINAWSKDAILF